MKIIQLLIFSIWSFFPWLGDDYDNYMVLIARPELAISFNIEPIALLIILLINQTGLSADWFFVAHAGVLTFFLRKIQLIVSDKFFFRDHTKAFLFLLLALLLVGPGISIVRQSVATVIVTYAVLKRLLYPGNGANLLYFGTIVLAAAFHYSALPVGLLLLGFIYVSISRFNLSFALFNLFLITMFVLLSSQIVQIGSSDNVYSSHLGRRAAVHAVSPVFYLTTLVYFLTPIMLVANHAKLARTSSNGIVFLCINVILLGGGIKIVAAEYLIFNRVVFFFNPFLIIGLSLACDRVRQQYVPYLLAMVFVVLLGFLILLKRGYL